MRRWRPPLLVLILTFLLVVPAAMWAALRFPWYVEPDCVLTKVSQHHDWVFGPVDIDLHRRPPLEQTMEYLPFTAKHYTCYHPGTDRVDYLKVVMPVRPDGVDPD